MGRKKNFRVPPDPGSPLHERMQDAWRHPLLKTTPLLLRECLHTFAPGTTARPDRIRCCWCYVLPGSPLLYVALQPTAEDVLKETWWKTARETVAKRVLHVLTSNRFPWKWPARQGEPPTATDASAPAPTDSPSPSAESRP